jgi:hypothetical protein
VAPGALPKHTCTTQAQRPLTVGGEWTCLDHEDCPDGEYTCYFQPLTSCLRDATTPSCGWVDNGQELDLPRPPLHPLCWAWEEEKEEEEGVGGGGGEEGGGGCVSHTARAQLAKRSAGRVKGRRGNGAKACGGASEDATSQACVRQHSNEHYCQGRATAASPPATSTSTPARGGRHQEAGEWGGGSAKTEGVHEHGVRVREPDLLIDPSSLSGGRELQVEAGRWGGQVVFSLSTSARWLTHPMGAITVLDLSRGHLTRHASQGPGTHSQKSCL